MQVELQDVVRIPPDQFGKDLGEVVKGLLKKKYESMIIPELGYIIWLSDVKPDPVGKVVPGDGASYHHVEFKVLTFYPKLQEVVEGEVVEVTDFGAFVRIGPTDSLLHISQIIDDYVNSDTKRGVITASQTKRILKVGSKIRARITAISLSRGESIGKIGITCRQQFLGALEWIEEDVRKAAEVEG
ncbi:MAG: DNA-directed RNA polymerase [Nitrososphaeria archaeon]